MVQDLSINNLRVSKALHSKSLGAVQLDVHRTTHQSRPSGRRAVEQGAQVPLAEPLARQHETMEAAVTADVLDGSDHVFDHLKKLCELSWEPERLSQRFRTPFNTLY